MQKKNILIIDDDEFISGLYGTLLERAGYRISYARNGLAGLKDAAKSKPNLILLDVMMPVMSGFDTLVRLKSSEKTKSIPVIMLTGLSNATDAQRGLNEGAAAYLTKTMTMPAEAFEKIEAVLKGVGIASPRPKQKKKH